MSQGQIVSADHLLLTEGQTHKYNFEYNEQLDHIPSSSMLHADQG